MTDFSRAIELKEGFVPALLERAEIYLRTNEKISATSDLDAADRAAAKQSNDRLRMARDYEDAEKYSSAIEQLNLWISAHEVDARMTEALNGRCWARALLNRDLDLALKDCALALRRADQPDEIASVYDSRGLIRLRQGAYAAAISDYDEALQRRPKNPWSMYGRGIAKIKSGRMSEGKADMVEAEGQWPEVAERYARLSLAP